MACLYRHDYQPDELDDPIGPIPTYANPGAIDNDAEHPHGHPGWARFQCRVHDTRWAVGGCWVCVDDTAAVAS